MARQIELWLIDKLIPLGQEPADALRGADRSNSRHHRWAPAGSWRRGLKEVPVIVLDRSP
jgi:hypothetical protein